MKRLHFLHLALFAILLASITALAAEPLFPKPPGVVSYTYREEFKKDVPGTLDLIKSLGIQDIEFSNLFGKTAAEMRALIDERGLKCSSYGTNLDDLQKNLAQVAETAKTLGASYVRIAWLQKRQPFTLELAKLTAREFNEIGKALREKYGITFCYHNHGYEFVPHGSGTLFDVLMNETRPEDVSFELDLLWAHFPGQDPAALLEKYRNRFKLIHLKDLKKGIATGDLSGKTDQDNDVALGTGQLDLPRILRIAVQVGVQHFYIEDESSSTKTQVPESLAFLKALTK